MEDVDVKQIQSYLKGIDKGVKLYERRHEEHKKKENNFETEKAAWNEKEGLMQEEIDLLKTRISQLESQLDDTVHGNRSANNIEPTPSGHNASIASSISSLNLSPVRGEIEDSNTLADSMGPEDAVKCYANNVDLSLTQKNEKESTSPFRTALNRTFRFIVGKPAPRVLDTTLTSEEVRAGGGIGTLANTVNDYANSQEVGEPSAHSTGIPGIRERGFKRNEFLAFGESIARNGYSQGKINWANVLEDMDKVADCPKFDKPRTLSKRLDSLKAFVVSEYETDAEVFMRLGFLL